MQVSQNQRVLNHLIDHGYITQAIASNYGIRRLASRINDLHTLGNADIRVERRYDDAGVPYAYYYMRADTRGYQNARRTAGLTWRFASLDAETAAA